MNRDFHKIIYMGKKSKKTPKKANRVTAAKVAYIVSAFPMLTETFILYEILAMEQLGLTIEVYPLLRKRDRVHHTEIDRLIKRTHYARFLSLPILSANWYFIRRSPSVYFKVWSEVLKGTFGSANFFFGALGIFPKAVRFAYEMANEKITHVHAQFANHPTVAALIIHRLTGIPFSFTARGSDVNKDRRMLDRKIEAAQFAITVSEYTKKVMVDECGPGAGDKIHVIYGGVDTDVLSPDIKSDSDGPLQILCVARFEEVKGQTYLVEACRMLRDRGVNFKCHLVGEGPLRSKIEKQITRAALEDRVKLHSACSHTEVIEKLSQADVVALATVPASSGKREGIPNVLKEAMACGLPVVGVAISGIPELVEHGKSGFLVAPRDTMALADALQRLNDDLELRRSMGLAGRQKIVRQFNLRTSAAKRAQLFLNGKFTPE